MHLCTVSDNDIKLNIAKDTVVPGTVLELNQSWYITPTSKKAPAISLSTPTKTKK